MCGAVAPRFCVATCVLLGAQVFLEIFVCVVTLTLGEATVGGRAECNAVRSCCFEIFVCVVTSGEATAGCSTAWHAGQSFSLKFSCA